MMFHGDEPRSAALSFLNPPGRRTAARLLSTKMPPDWKSNFHRDDFICPDASIAISLAPGGTGVEVSLPPGQRTST